MFLFPSINSISPEIIQQQDQMKIVQVVVVVLLLGLLVCVETSENQKVVSDIVNAITKSGINSGINEAQLRRVLNSDSMNTSKATINVINLVPKKKAAGTLSGLPSPLLTQNTEVGNRISETTNLPKLVLSESYTKQKLPVFTTNIENKCLTVKDKPIEILNPPIVQNPYVVINEPIKQVIPLVNTQPTNLQNPFQQSQPTEPIKQQNTQTKESSSLNPFELQKNLNYDSSPGSKSINIAFQTGPFISPTLPCSKGKILGTNNKVNSNSKSLNINISGNKTDKDKTPFSLKQFLGLSKKSKTPNNNPTSSKQKNCPKPPSPQPCCCCCEEPNSQIDTEDLQRRYNRFSSQQP